MIEVECPVAGNWTRAGVPGPALREPTGGVPGGVSVGVFARGIRAGTIDSSINMGVVLYIDATTAIVSVNVTASTVIVVIGPGCVP